MKEWKELKIDNLPPDILTGDYEFEYIRPHHDEYSTYLGQRYSMIARMVADGQIYRYRLRQHEPPSHEEIMTNWWNAGGVWMRVVQYEPREPYPYTLSAYRASVNRKFFIDVESAIIPPEVIL